MEKVRKMIDTLPAGVVEYARKVFKITVFGVKNNFVLAGILTIGFCVIAPAVFLTATIDSTVDAEELWYIMGIYSIIAAYVGGLLIPAVMFSYVHKRRDRDFYHAMPVRRGQYFIGYFLAGLAMFAAPYLMMCVIMGLAGGHVGTTFYFVFQSLALYIVIYATVLLSIMFSGSILSSIVTLVFLNTFPVIVTYCSIALRGNIDSNAYMQFLEPYIYIFTPLSGGYSLAQFFLEGPFYWILWVQLGVAVIELALSFIMYKLRRGETTMAVAFPKTRYILQYGTMFLVALFCTTLFNAFYWSSSAFNPETVIWTAIMVFVTFVILNMILERSFRAAFHKIRHLFVFAGAYVVVLSVIIGIVSGLPFWVVPIKTDAVLIRYTHYEATYEKPANYNYDGYYDDGFYSVNDEGKTLYHNALGNEERYVVTDPKQVAELTKRISEYENDSWRDYSNSYYYTEGEYYSVTFTLYTLKPGKKIEQGMFIDDIENISSQRYFEHIGDISVSEFENFMEGMDTIRTYYRNYDYSYNFAETTTEPYEIYETAVETTTTEIEPYEAA